MVEGVDLAADVRALKQRLKASRSRVRDVELGDMTIFGAWVSVAAVPEDAGDATRDRRLAPNIVLSSLIGATGDYFFVVSIPAAPPASAADYITRGEAEVITQRAAQIAIAEWALVEAFNPFARSHHSDIISPSASNTGSPSPTLDALKAERRAFKLSVAEFYGLTQDDRDSLKDMLGIVRRFDQVTLAHIWPESYHNFSDYAREMALPEDFHHNPRNFLLIPSDLHHAFDAGKVGFVSSKDAITIRVFRREGLIPAVLAMDGLPLVIPKEAPYKRQLGWFAWLAKSSSHVSEEALEKLEASLSASQSGEGNTASRVLVDKAKRTGKIII